MQDNIIQKYFHKYLNSRENFDIFHNEVINMPRDSFSKNQKFKLRSISAYLLLIQKRVNFRPVSYKQILYYINKEQKKLPLLKWRDKDFEDTYLFFRNINIHYEKNGRMFRHLMEIALFFGLIKNGKNKSQKIINFAKCNEFYFSNDDIFTSVVRNNLLMMNINNNDLIKNLTGIKLREKSNYHPVKLIIKYMLKIKRPVSQFELSILFGRVDSVQNDDKIYKRAIDISNFFTANEEQQKTIFFKSLGWINKDGSLFNYRNSQKPEFKFNSLFLLLSEFDLIKKTDNNKNLFILSSYSTDDLANKNIPLEIADLQNLIIDSTKLINNYEKLRELIVSQRSEELKNAILKDSTLIEKLNFYSLMFPLINSKNKRVRNPIISEVAKIIAGYTCQVTNKKTFLTPTGKNYVEAHHIIEFSSENGPDITDNLLILGPEKHSLMHKGSINEVQNQIEILKKNGINFYARFQDMVYKYQCLEKNQLDRIFSKNFISRDQYNLLIKHFEREKIQ